MCLLAAINMQPAAPEHLLASTGREKFLKCNPSEARLSTNDSMF